MRLEVWAKDKAAGYLFEFRQAGGFKHPASTANPPGSTVLTSAFLFNEGIENNHQFPGALPLGVTTCGARCGWASNRCPRTTSSRARWRIDLTPSYRVRLRFKHAQTVTGAAAGVGPTTFVFAGVAYFRDAAAGRQPFSAGLPEAIRPTDDIAGALGRVGAPPTGGDYAGADETVYAVWEDRNPVLHVLFGEEPKHPLKVTVFLAASKARPL